jgi:hypothetical protein
MNSEAYHVILFDSVSSALLAEKILKKHDLPFKIIPVPRHISSDCGVCIRFSSPERDRIESALAGRVEIQDICPL